MIKGIQSGGILMLISPTLRSRIIHTTHRCSGRLFLVHIRHNDTELVIIALYGVSAPATDDKKSMRTLIVADRLPHPITWVGARRYRAFGRTQGRLVPYRWRRGCVWWNIPGEVIANAVGVVS